MIDVHPDDLLHKGELSDDERARLDAHLKGCRACAIERQLAEDCRVEQLLTDRDDDLIARSIDRVLAEPPVRRRKILLYVLVAAAAVMFTFFAWARLHRASPTPPPVVPVEQPVVTTTAKSSVETPAPPPPAPTPTVIEQPKPAPTVSAPRASAAELFASANEARRGGSIDHAITLYRQLQSLYPSSPEALTSRVAFGRLLLDKTGDASGARAQFNAYLATAPSGTLAEEARVGVALAAAKLGDAAGERAAWQELLAKHPDSVHADRARKRIEELEK